MTGEVIVTISRQLGSGGSYVGRQVADRLGIKYIDREILRRVAAYLQEDRKVVAAREERVSGLWETVMQAVTCGTPEAGYVPPPLRPVSDADLLAAEIKIMKELTENCSAVIAGRAGFHILKGTPNLVKVFLHAPREYRINRVMKNYNLPDYRSAEEIVDESDRQRKKFVKMVSNLEWTDASCYHLCIDTEAAGFMGATEMILTLVEKMLRIASARVKKAAGQP